MELWSCFEWEKNENFLNGFLNKVKRDGELVEIKKNYMRVPRRPLILMR